MNKKIFNQVRNYYFLSKLMRISSKPIQKVCETFDRQIRMKVWVNGEPVNYDGVKLHFPRNIGVGYSSNIYWNGVEGFEPLTWKVIKNFLEKSNYFIDVGANIGFYSVLAKKVNPDIMVHSYEPIPSIFAKNISFHKANSLPSTNIHNTAIGDKDGVAEIFLPIVDDSIEEQTTATLKEDSWQFNKKHETFRANIMKLDTILDGKLPEDKVFLKIDVEDYEASVLRGAVETLRNTKPIIVCEILPREHGNQETSCLLEESNYVAFGISKEGLVRFNKDDFLGPRTFTDFLLIPNTLAPKLNYIGYANINIINW